MWKNAGLCVVLFFMAAWGSLWACGGGGYGIVEGGCISQLKAQVIPHDDIETYRFHGNILQGVATPSLGAHEMEVWRSSWEVGGATPKHVHESDEIFIFLKGKGRAVIGEEEFFFEAPCTIICPAHIPHQLFNVGNEPTDSILVLKAGSRIYDKEGKEMSLPWRD